MEDIFEFNLLCRDLFVCYGRPVKSTDIRIFDERRARLIIHKNQAQRSMINNFFDDSKKHDSNELIAETISPHHSSNQGDPKKQKQGSGKVNRVKPDSSDSTLQDNFGKIDVQIGTERDSVFPPINKKGAQNEMDQSLDQLVMENPLASPPVSAKVSFLDSPEKTATVEAKTSLLLAEKSVGDSAQDLKQKSTTRIVTETKFAQPSSESRLQASSNDNSNALAKSLAGFDFSSEPQVGSFFSTLNQGAGGPAQNFIDTSTMTGSKYIDELVAQRQNQHDKKLPFEYGVYHQCIPNPHPDHKEQLITVQIVQRALGFKDDDDDDDKKAQENEDISGFPDVDQNKFTATSQKVQRYSLKSPQADNDDSELENEEAAGEIAGTGRAKLIYAGADKNLYKDSALNRENDFRGTRAKLYAEIEKNDESQAENKKALTGCSQFAVVAFWDPDQKTGLYSVSRYFLVTNPLTRAISQSNNFVQRQLLYVSNQKDTHEVFFFYKDVDSSNGDSENGEQSIKIAYLKLDLSQEELQQIGDKRDVQDYVREFPIRKNSILAEFIIQTDKRGVSEQQRSGRLLPNPTVIKNERDAKEWASIVVFTAFMKEKNNSGDQSEEGEEKEVSDNWYPTVFFYDVAKDKVVWQIFGADLFITSFTNGNFVYVLQNEMWPNAKQDQIKCEEDQFRENDCYISELLFGTYPTEKGMRERDERVPESPITHRFIVQFGAGQGFHLPMKTMSEYYKNDAYEVVIPEAFAHGSANRVTIIFKGVCSFTFELKDGVNIAKTTNWKIQTKKYNFKAALKYSDETKALTGKGSDDDNHEFSISVKLDHEEKNDWTGYIRDLNYFAKVEIEQLKVDTVSKTVSGAAKLTGPDQQSENFEISGSIQEINETTGRWPLEFSFRSGRRTINFDHSILSLTKDYIHGQWANENEEKTLGNFFIFRLASKVDGTLELRSKKNGKDISCLKKKISVDFIKYRIQSEEEGERDLLSFKTLNAAPTAELIYYFNEKDCRFTRRGDKSFIVCVLFSRQYKIETGYSLTTIAVFNISNEKKGKRDLNKPVGMAEDYIVYYFSLKQSFKQTYKMKDKLLLDLSACALTEDKLISAVIYEESGSSELVLNFISAKLGASKTEPDYPQGPVAQSWIVDYPLLAYKTYTPKNKELTIVHMTLDMPQRVIHLGEWEFVCFVNHSQWTERQMFEKWSEDKCNIFFLARRENMIRLMCFKESPFRSFSNKPSTSAFASSAEIHIFSGEIKQKMPNDSVFSDENSRRWAQRFNNDKIQTCQLITRSYNTKLAFVLLIQLDDCLIHVGLTDQCFKVISEPQNMVKRHMIRGYNEKVFFAEKAGHSTNIVSLEMDKIESEKIIREEIFQLAGHQIVALENDKYNIQEDYWTKEVDQAFYIMDDAQKVHRITRNKDTDGFQVEGTMDFSQHKQLAVITALKEADWVHMCISGGTIAFGNNVYSLSSSLSYAFSLPTKFFGQQKDSAGANSSQADNSDEDSSWRWRLKTAQNMQNTTNLLGIAQSDTKESCFVVKPGPGSRKISLMANQFFLEIKRMIFVSPSHVFVSFWDGKSVVLLSNGSEVSQTCPKVQKILQDDFEIAAESEVSEGLKTVLIRSRDLSKLQALQFDLRGQGKVVGIFNGFKADVGKSFLDLEEAHRKYEATMDQVMHRAAHGVQRIVKRTVAQLKDKDGSQEDQVSLSHQYFASEKGHIVTIGAFVSDNPDIQEGLKDWSFKAEEKPTQKENCDYVSILDIKSNDENSAGTRNMVKVQVILFHCRDQSQRDQLAHSTQFCLVQNYLVYRNKQSTIVWILKLREPDDDQIKASCLSGADEIYTRIQRKYFDLSGRTEENDLKKIRIQPVPKSSFANNEKRPDEQLQLCQISTSNEAYIFDLISNREVTHIEVVKTLTDADRFVNTGINLSHCPKEQYWGDSIVPNEFGNLIFQECSRPGENYVWYKLGGILLSTFSEMNLRELKHIKELIDKNQRLDDIDMSTITSTFQGHTIFSIFYEEDEVYEKILQQIKDKNWEPEMDEEGNEVEDPKLRALYRVLKMPTSAFLSKYDKQDEQDNQDEQDKQDKQDERDEQDKKARELDKGFKSVLKKSLHLNNLAFRDSLIEICMKCQEGQVSDFVDNIDDLAMLFETSTPAVFTLLNDGMTSSRFTDSFTRLQWKSDKQLQVVQSLNSFIDEENVNRELNGEKEDSSLQSRPVEAQVMEINFIFAATKSRAKNGFQELVLALARAPQESIFSTELISVLLPCFWDRYSRKIMMTCFMPFIFNFFGTIYYFSNYTVEGIPEKERWSFTLELVLRFLIIILNSYFAYFDFHGILREGITSLRTIGNLLYISSYVLNFFLIIETIILNKEERQKESEKDRLENLRSAVSLATIIMWTKVFYWMRLFGPTSFYVRLVKETLYDVRNFLFLFFAILMTFANVYFILNKEREAEIYNDFVGQSVLNTITNQYLISLGEFDMDNYQSGSEDRLLWFFFLLTTFITQITFLNMLIAIMGDTFSRVSETKDQSALVEKIRILADYVVVVGHESIKDKNEFRYVFSFKLKDTNEEADDSWGSTVSQLKKAIDLGVEKGVNKMAKTVESVQAEVTTVEQQVQSLSQRVVDMQRTIERRVDDKFDQVNETLAKILEAQQKQ